MANIHHHFHPDDLWMKDEELDRLRERLESLERDGYLMRDSMEKLSEMVEMTLRSLQEEEYKVRVSYEWLKL